MKLSECKLGEIVQANDVDEFGIKPIGHIIGLDRVFYTSPKLGKTYYVIVIVEFVNGEKISMHPDLLNKLEN
jgi:hypothetical protein